MNLLNFYKFTPFRSFQSNRAEFINRIKKLMVLPVFKGPRAFICHFKTSKCLSYYWDTIPSDLSVNPLTGRNRPRDLQEGMVSFRLAIIKIKVFINDAKS